MDLKAIKKELDGIDHRCAQVAEELVSEVERLQKVVSALREELGMKVAKYERELADEKNARRGAEQALASVHAYWRKAEDKLKEVTS